MDSLELSIKINKWVSRELALLDESGSKKLFLKLLKDIANQITIELDSSDLVPLKRKAGDFIDEYNTIPTFIQRLLFSTTE